MKGVGGREGEGEGRDEEEARGGKGRGAAVARERRTSTATAGRDGAPGPPPPHHESKTAPSPLPAIDTVPSSHLPPPPFLAAPSPPVPAFFAVPPFLSPLTKCFAAAAFEAATEAEAFAAAWRDVETRFAVDDSVLAVRVREDV